MIVLVHSGEYNFGNHLSATSLGKLSRTGLRGPVETKSFFRNNVVRTSRARLSW